LSHTKLTENALEMLCSSLPKEITQLELILSNTSIADKNISTLIIESLRKITNLNTLELYLEDTKITDKSLASFSEFFKDNAQIYALTLDLQQTRIYDEILCYFIDEIVPTMSNLENCYLEVSESQLQKPTLDKISHLHNQYPY